MENLMRRLIGIYSIGFERKERLKKYPSCRSIGSVSPFEGEESKRSCIFMKYMCFLCPELCQVFYICYVI